MLTQLGTFHTLISLIAVFAAFISYFRYKDISLTSTLGKVYVFTTVIVCVTGFGIFQHGGLGKPHALGILTLIVLAAAAVAEYSTLFGRLSPYVRTLSYSASFLFHWIPAITETTTRLPAGAPLFDSPEAPELQAIAGFLVLLFLIGATLQVRRLRAMR
ncbi:MAG: hypothetical protein JWL63_631 [Rhodocyclales bacterium]|nr:hypothetical protein [Rhodocyclales bacterium]